MVSRNDLKELTRVSMTDRNRKLVPGSWSQERERTLTTRLGAEEWYSGHSVQDSKSPYLITEIKLFVAKIIITHQSRR